MKSKISLFISFSMLLAVSFASEQRIASLGGNAGFWEDDDQNIYMFPSTMHNFNIAQIDGNDDMAKASFLFGESTKYGFFMNSNSDELLNIAYGSGSWGLLVGFDTNSAKYTETDADDEEASSLNMKLAFGLSSSFGELGVNLNTHSIDNAEGDDPSSFAFGLNLRREQPIWEFSHMLVSFNFMSNELGTYAVDLGSGPDDFNYDDMTSLDLNVDLYRHWNLTEKTDLLFALGFGYMSASAKRADDEVEREVDVTTMVLPRYTFAVETNLLDWATIRAGVNQHHFLSNSAKYSYNEIDSDNYDFSQELSGSGASDFNLLFGIGANYGGFKLDADLNPGFFIDPVSYITGFNGETIATQFSITYTW